MVLIADAHRGHVRLNNEKLDAVVRPTIVVISGLFGSGKTSALSTILNSVEMPKSECAAIFNEKFVDLARADASRVVGIDTIAMGGCACCLSNEELRSTVDRFVRDGRKLIVVEQSGATNGAQLKASLQRKFGTSVDVRLLTLVDAERLKAPPAVLHAAVSVADSVVITHSKGDTALVTAASGMVNEVAGNPPDFIQLSPGEISNHLWRSMLKGRLSGAREYALSAGDLLERKKIRDGIEATTLMLFEEVDLEALKQLLARSPYPITRAKGVVRAGGELLSIQYEMKSETLSHFSSEPALDSQIQIYSGRPYLNLMSIGGAPPSEHFLSIGIPSFRASDVDYFLSLYPSTEALDNLVSRRQPIPVVSDADTIAHQVFRLADHSHTFPPDVKVEFDQAFIRSISAFINWRLDLIPRIKAEATIVSSPDYGERMASLGYSLCWIACKYGHILGAVLPREWERLLGSGPSDLLFEGLINARRLEIDGRSELTDSEINDMEAFIALGMQYQKPALNSGLLSRALSKIKDMVTDGRYSGSNGATLLSLVSRLED